MGGYQASGGAVDGPLNQIASAQTITAGNTFTLDGTIGSGYFDKPRHLCFKSAGADVMRRFVINGVDENGVTRTVTALARSSTIWLGHETVWKKINSITATDGTVSTVSVGVTFAYDEIYTLISKCKDFLVTNGFTRGSDIFISPNGQITPLVIRVLKDLGYTKHRGTRSNNMQPFLAPTPLGIPSIGNGIANGGSATLTAYVSKVTGRWSPITFYLHKIVPDSNATPATTEARLSDYRLFMDSIISAVSSGNLTVVSLSDFCNLVGY
jgi:hypothetical protein